MQVSDYSLATYVLVCHGRLLPRESPGIEYKVEYKIFIRDGSVQRGKPGEPIRATCTKFLVRSVDSHPIPEGHYDLHSDDGFTRHLQYSSGKWRFE